MIEVFLKRDDQGGGSVLIKYTWMSDLRNVFEVYINRNRNRIRSNSAKEVCNCLRGRISMMRLNMTCIVGEK